MSPTPSQHEHARSAAPPAQAAGNTPPNGSFIGSDTSPIVASPTGKSNDLPITRLKQYRLLELIGRGGMGDVYRAHDETFDRIVAIKVLPSDLAEDESFVHRFQREAKAIAGLSHPHIVPVYEIDQVAGCCYFAMQLVDGESLERRLRRVKQLTLDETLRIITACLSALETAHAKGLVHRDIKPGNLLLQAGSDHVYVVDFGLVRRIDDQSLLTVTGMVMGTVDYMAPEQARGAKQIDGRADLYSVGAMFYHLLAGQLPFASNSFTSMLYSHAYEQPAPLDAVAPETPPALVALIHQLLEKDPQKRPPNCAAVLQALEPFRTLEFRSQFVSEAVERVAKGSAAARESTLHEQLSADYGVWQQVQDRVQTAWRRRCPQWLAEMQSLEQQLAEELDVTQRRLHRLRSLRQEGQQLLNELTTEEAAQQAETAERQASLVDQLAFLDLEIAKASAQHARLSSQRDVVSARMLTVGGGRSATHQRQLLPIAIVSCAAVLLAGLGYSFWPRAESEQAHAVTPSPAEHPPLPSGGANPSNGHSPSGSPPEALPTVTPSYIEGSVEPLTVTITANPTDAEAYRRRARWYLARQQWLAAANDMAAIYKLRPHDSSTGGDLATIYLGLEDSSAYDRICASLSQRLPTETEKWKTWHSVRALLLGAKVQPEHWQVAEAKFHEMEQKAPEDNLLVRWRPVKLYRQGNWQGCVTAADTYLPGGPRHYHEYCIWIYRALALHRLGKNSEAQASLAQIQQAFEQMKFESAMQGRTESKEQLFWWWNLDGLHTQIAYREASELILGTREELRIAPILFATTEPTIKKLPGLSEIYETLAVRDAMITATPWSVHAYLSRGRWFEARGRWQEACADYEKSLELDSKWWLRNNVARLYLYLEQPADYERHCRLLLTTFAEEKSPSARSTALRPLTLLPEMWATELQQHDKTVSGFPLSDDPSEGDTLRLVLSMHYRQGRWKACITLADRIMPNGQRDIFAAVPGVYRAMALHQMGLTAEAKTALAEWKRLMEQFSPGDMVGGWYDDNSVDSRLFWYMSHGREAQILYREASQLILGQRAELTLVPIVDEPPFAPPEAATAYFTKGRNLFAEQKWQAAREAYAAGMRHHPAAGFEHADYASLCLAVGDEAAARQEFPRLFTKVLEPQLQRDERIQMLRVLTLRPAPAAEFQKIGFHPIDLREQPKWSALVNAGLVYRQGNWREAERIAGEYLQRYPNDNLNQAQAMLWRAMALWQIGKRELAKTTLAAVADIAKPQRPVPGAPAWHFAADKLYTTLLYREASQLILGSSREITISAE